jgi:hypothetical protein
MGEKDSEALDQGCKARPLLGRHGIISWEVQLYGDGFAVVEP